MAADEPNSPKGVSKDGPGRRAGGRRARSPVTIDLEAKTVSPTQEPSTQDEREDEAAAAPSPTPEEGRPEQQDARPVTTGERPGIIMLAIAGLIGGLAALGLGLALQSAGVLPSPGESVATKALAETERLVGSTSTLDQRMTSVEAASNQMIADRAVVDDLSRRMGAIDAFGASLSDRILNLEATITSLNERVSAGGNAATRETVDALAARVGRLEGAAPAGPGTSPSSPMALGALDSRIDALEKTVAALETRVTSLATAPAEPLESEPTARAVAVESLRQAAGRGGPFAGELAAFQRLGIADQQLAELAPLAEKGAPSRADLVVRFPAVADAILAAREPGDPKAGLLDRVIAYGSSLVKIRPTGPMQGSDPMAVVSRMQAAVDAGDLGKALSERTALPPAAQAASQQWAAEVSNRLAIDRLLDEIAKTSGPAEGSG